MSQLGALLERQSNSLLTRWTESLGQDVPTQSSPELRSHVPGLLRELREALREGRAPLSSASAADHGNRRQECGFDVEAVVREYRLLLNAILDSAEAEGLVLTMGEVRIVTEFISRAVAQGVAAHRRHELGVQQRLGQTREKESQSAEVARRRLEGLFQNAPAFMAAVHGPSHIFTLVNEPYHRLVGVGRPLIGMSVAEALPEVVPQGFIGLLDTVYRTGVAHVGNETAVRLRRNGGMPEDAYVDFVYQPTRDANGTVDGIDVFGFEVTEKVQARKRVDTLFQQLRVGQEELRLVVDAMPLLVSFVAADERYGLVNAAYEDWFGVARESIRGRKVEDVVGQKAYAQLGKLVKRGLAGERFNIEQYGVKYASGGTRDVSITFIPRRNSAGEVEGYVSVIDDITQRRLLEAERERLLEAERAARAEADVQRDLATAVAAKEGTSRRASEEARARTEFLLRVAGALSGSLELRVILQRLVEIIAPDHAALASVWSALPGRSLERIVHTGPSSTLDSTGAAALAVERVIETSKAFHVVDYRAWLIAREAPAGARSIAALGVGPVLFLPIHRDGAAVAVLAVARFAGATFSDEDIALFESAAHLAALAFESARLFGEMVQLRTDAEDATVAKDRFLARVSHDLRNPLNSILGWSALLRGMKNDPTQLTRGIDVIERNAKAQVQLVEDLLDVSRIASGKLALELAVEDVHSAIDTALDAARLAASSKNISLTVSVDDDIGDIAVDRDRFRQILWNLVSNAVKFTPNGGTVTVTAQRLASTFQLVVSDNGCGISAEFLPRVFGAFEQAEAGMRRSGGLGLGLAIVRRLVELHGGTIRVDSDGEGQGSRFTVELPIRAAVESSRVSSKADSPKPLAGVRVLVVDDEDDARGVVSAILDHAGASTTSAASAEQALATLLQFSPHVIISDIGMPGKDGKAFIREVRSLPEERGRRLPAVALTALVRAKDRVEILAAGFNSHVPKPVEPSELVLVIAGLLGLPLPEIGEAATG